MGNLTSQLYFGREAMGWESYFPGPAASLAQEEQVNNTFRMTAAGFQHCDVLWECSCPKQVAPGAAGTWSGGEEI